MNSISGSNQLKGIARLLVNVLEGVQLTSKNSMHLFICLKMIFVNLCSI